MVSQEGRCLIFIFNMGSLYFWSMFPLIIKVKVKSLSHVRLFADPMDCSLLGSSVRGKNTGVGCHSLLQGIFLTQGLNLGLLHCRQTLYHLSHQGLKQTRSPWWLSGKEPTGQCKGLGFDPWSRKTSCAAEQLSPCTMTTEPVLWSLGTAMTEARAL